MLNLEQQMAEYGFYLTDTGGGCTAYIHVQADGKYVVITRAGDADAPADWRQQCDIGIYSTEETLISHTSGPLSTIFKFDWVRAI